MTEWESKVAAEKTYINAVSFFNGKMRAVEVYEQAIRNSTERHRFESANSAVEIDEGLRVFMEEIMGEKANTMAQKNAEHALQMSELQSNNQHQGAKLRTVSQQLSEL